MFKDSLSVLHLINTGADVEKNVPNDPNYRQINPKRPLPLKSCRLI